MADSGGHDFRMQKHAPPPSTTENDPWEEVKDPQTGDIYWWNTETDETTAVGLLQQNHPTHFKSRLKYLTWSILTSVGEPNPGLEAPQPQREGLGQVLKEGLAFGTGSAIAHSVIGSIFGGFGGGDDEYDDDDW